MFQTKQTKLLFLIWETQRSNLKFKWLGYLARKARLICQTLTAINQSIPFASLLCFHITFAKLLLGRVKVRKEASRTWGSSIRALNVHLQSPSPVELPSLVVLFLLLNTTNKSTSYFTSLFPISLLCPLHLRRATLDLVFHLSLKQKIS